MFNLEEIRQDQKKKMVSVFVVDKRSHEIVKPAKDMVLHQLPNLGVKVQAIIASSCCVAPLPLKGRKTNISVGHWGSRS